jgi:hypothetical protein
MDVEVAYMQAQWYEVYHHHQLMVQQQGCQ